MDQIDGTAKYIENSKVAEATVDEFLDRVFSAVGINKGYISFGDNHKAIRQYDYNQQLDLRALQS